MIVILRIQNDDLNESLITPYLDKDLLLFDSDILSGELGHHINEIIDDFLGELVEFLFVFPFAHHVNNALFVVNGDIDFGLHEGDDVKSVDSLRFSFFDESSGRLFVQDLVVF